MDSSEQTTKERKWRPRLEDLLLRLGCAYFLGVSIDRPKLSKDLTDARNDAQKWENCLCGEFCTELPKRDSGSPEDPELRKIGNEFFYEVDAICHHLKRPIIFDLKDKQWSKELSFPISRLIHSIKLLEKIEYRAGQLMILQLQDEIQEEK